MLKRQAKGSDRIYALRAEIFVRGGENFDVAPAGAPSINFQIEKCVELRNALFRHVGIIMHPYNIFLTNQEAEFARVVKIRPNCKFYSNLMEHNQSTAKDAYMNNW